MANLMGRLNKRHRPVEIDITPEILKSLQKIQLECLVELDRICRKHSIKYSIDGGTLLGAVRHNGFIPWDDDIDVIMTRNEYERFFHICKTELNAKDFFLQEPRTDSFYRVGFPRLKRNNTIYIRAGQEDSRQHNGVQIDVFVLDNMPDNLILSQLHCFITFFFRKALWARTGKIVSKTIALRAFYTAFDFIPAKFPMWGFDTLARVCNRKPSKLIRHYGMTYPTPKVNGRGIPAELMDDFTELVFEGQKFMAVAEHDRYLSLLYGDYMELPPEEKRKPRIKLSKFEGNYQ